MKLSEQQLRLLAAISMYPKHCVDYYPPAKKLVALGLAMRPEDYPDKLAITDKGLAFLETLSKPQQ